MTEYTIAILGAGIGGLGMAAKLKKEGKSSFVVLEKADAVGGTWRENTYPGAACDVQSHLYWYSFDDQQPDWTRLYAQQPEIRQNVESFVERYDLAPHIRLNAEVNRAEWDHERGRWLIGTTAGEQIVAEVFVGAWGQLNRPSFKGIEGRESFRGASFHSAQWRHDVDLAGKRVAVVGNGASAVQIVPQIAGDVASLTVFQRSANYHVPRMDRAYDQDERQLYRGAARLLESREAFFAEHESWVGAMKLDANPVLDEFYRIARELLETQVPDAELREKLWPDYPLGCKRVLVADDYYPALMRDNVELVTERIAEVVPEGLRTRDGAVHELDVVIYATGFETLSFLGDLEITGRDGRSLRDVWHDGARAYLGTTVSGFPNLFLLYGPNTNLGHNSIILMLECQYDYVLQALRTRAETSAVALDVRREAMHRFNDRLQETLRGTAFAGGCTSWYKTADGHITNNWSGSVGEYQEAMRTFRLDDYEVLQPATA
ncbi:cation diffusion facilitator CzcD-associated flavoprotein CzcO [Blastococcus colisei]|uniref:Cation diffusion facilitator CzcD-associated flavoprotein CzcO n=1 Tax=Blastococcus colisei TaxID=1564162 RepID=A0A543PAK7_9ACTN|nr:NAD(P)/FAD-dependent oxidoreductase [Blastococcus colisei]TQN41117.1 cation diffusion facilitator CzcD-associated flavoprotein CzcO [Blastococcus colisei]